MTTGRVEALDATRGFALLGIMLINVMTFRDPARTWTGAEHVVDQASLVLAQTKFVTLFSLAFGASFALRTDTDRPVAARWVRRMAALLLIGALHFVLLWEGDILVQYVPAGLALLLVARRSARVRLWWGVGILAAFVAVATVGAALTAARGGGTAAGSQDMRLPVDLYAHGSYADLVAGRLALLPEHLLVGIGGLPFTLGVFLLGAAAARAFTAPRRLVARIAVPCLVVGLVLNVLVIGALPGLGTMAPGPRAVFTIGIFTAVIVLALGYGGLVVLAGKRLSWLAPVGRMSLTNYLLQSVALTTVAYGYGLGWFTQLTPVRGLLLVAVVFAAQVLLSHAWLARFRYGPVEWAWRCATEWRPVALRIREPVTP